MLPRIAKAARDAWLLNLDAQAIATDVIPLQFASPGGVATGINVEASDGPLGGKMLRCPVVNNVRFLRFSPSIGVADQEVLMLFKTPDTLVANSIRRAVLLREGNGSVLSAYTAVIATSTTDPSIKYLAIYKYVNGVNALLAFVPMAWGYSEFRWMRFSAIGSLLTVRSWLYGQPEASGPVCFVVDGTFSSGYAGLVVNGASGHLPMPVYWWSADQGPNCSAVGPSG